MSFRQPTQQELASQRQMRGQWSLSEGYYTGGGSVTTGGSNTPAQAFRFYVEITGIIRAMFKECRGLELTRDVKEVEEGGTNDFVYKMPGRVKQSNITLTRGITYGHELWDWFQRGLYDGRVKRINMSLIMGNDQLLIVKRWDIYDAYPVKWSGADLSTETLQVAMETVELAHHGLYLSSDVKTPLGNY